MAEGTLSTDELVLFYKLRNALFWHINQHIQIAPDLEDLDQLMYEPLETVVTLRNTFVDQPNRWLDSFVEENPTGLPEAELDVARSWRYLVVSPLWVFRYLKNYTVFLDDNAEAPIAYGVYALIDPLDFVLDQPLPVLADAVLLPLRDKIVYDGMLSTYNMIPGPGIRRRLNEAYRQAKERMGGIVTSLPAKPKPPTRRAAKKPRQPSPEQSAKEKVREKKEEIVRLLNEFCAQHLNEEYAEMCRKMAEKLARKRPSPLINGQPNTWAAGIVRTVGAVNFLHDKSQTPHMKLNDIDPCFGVSSSTGAAKAAAIRKLLRVSQLDCDWTLPSRVEDNPMFWLIEVNGFVMDARSAPREIQELAFRNGLIPYIPADRNRE